MSDILQLGTMVIMAFHLNFFACFKSGHEIKTEALWHTLIRWDTECVRAICCAVDSKQKCHMVYRLILPSVMNSCMLLRTLNLCISDRN